MNLVVIGAQWGDEGKGKMVDYLASEADVIVRFSGGANAGHTIVHGERTYKLHLVPSGILYPGKTVVLGSGMVIDPQSLFQELADLEKEGVDWKGRVLISSRAHIVLPGYKELDKRQDSQRKKPIGTTGRGIGIAYSLKSSRDGIRMADLDDDNRLSLLDDSDRSFLEEYRERLKEMMVDITSFIHGSSPERMLLEGAQGVLLDLDLGTYPFVSSGYSAAAGASLGAGIGPRQIDGILGVFKAYSTRVGNGPFPSEFTSDRDGELEHRIRDIGREYGATTGRPRRCGYLDLVALRYACISNGLDGLILTKIDVYDSFDEIQVCVGYEIDGKQYRDFPVSVKDLQKATPVLKKFAGWKKDVTGIDSYEQLPEEVKEYISYIEDFTETPVTVVSVGPERSQTIIRQELWTQY
ncbi:adenylosuccinate synthase [Salinispira pacifica]|uniref:Adenylosuccinate synthetase n=1 Tax=Salinispira pacifica TaxID=1307761 RepID=V5WHD1_9SPIO|nr:adenylosuccinate synthase [Salinispira pacifica]AHC15218.1 Adenylosuccinate synthetase [Salinispira pacifica]